MVGTSSAWSGILRRVYWCLVVKITKSSSGIPALAQFYQHCLSHQRLLISFLMFR